MTLKEQVKNILIEYPTTRNSDITLTILLWKTYYSHSIGENDTIRLSALYDLPREDNIKRIRADFNARGHFYPTDLGIARGRGIEEEEWRQKLGYPRKTETYYPTKNESYTDKVAQSGML